MVRALSSHQCGRGSTPGVDALCLLSLLLVLSLAPRGFSLGTPVFPSPRKPTLSNSNLIWNARTRLNEFIRNPMCFVACVQTSPLPQKKSGFFLLEVGRLYIGHSLIIHQLYIHGWVYEPARTSADQFTTAKTAWRPM